MIERPGLKSLNIKEKRYMYHVPLWKQSTKVATLKHGFRVVTFFNNLKVEKM